MNVKELYERVRGNVMNVRSLNRNIFVQLVGEHAVHFVDLLRADRENDKRRMMSTWVKISELNKEWLNLMCPVLHEKNLQFYQVSQRLINDYSEVLGDFILDANTIHSEKSRSKVDNIARLEGDFYAALVDPNKREATKKQWQEYTHSIGTMIRYHDVYGPESDAFLHAAAMCIQSGKLLGAWLDTSI